MRPHSSLRAILPGIRLARGVPIVHLASAPTIPDAEPYPSWKCIPRLLNAAKGRQGSFRFPWHNGDNEALRAHARPAANGASVLAGIGNEHAERPAWLPAG